MGMIYLAFKLPPEVMATFPVGRPFRHSVALMRLHFSIILGPPLRWIAPSTPPPPMRVELAAFTMASVSMLLYLLEPNESAFYLHGIYYRSFFSSIIYVYNAKT